MNTAGAAKADLLQALGRVVRGLSTLFWALPLTLIVYVVTAETDKFSVLGAAAFAPAMVLSLMPWHGINQLRSFQKQERIWQRALNRAEVFAVVNTGLAPFLFWWHEFPSVQLNSTCAGLLLFSTLLLIVQINCVLQRLSAMLPDENLRAETKLFTTFNISLLLTVFGLLAAYLGLQQFAVVQNFLDRWIEPTVWLVLFLILMPIAMTLALIWKIKEVVFAAILDANR